MVTTKKPARQDFQLSEEGLLFIKKELNRYETRRSAIFPCLYQVQKEKGWISPQAVKYLSQVMKIPESYIHEVLTFYTLYNKKPVGKLHIQVCCNLSCAMNGSRELLKFLCQKFNVKTAEMSADGSVTIRPVECLGACDIAPVAQINEKFVGPLADHQQAYKSIQNMVTKLKG